MSFDLIDVIKGNQMGPKPKYTVKALMNKFIKYIEWARDHPLKEDKVMVADKQIQHVDVKKILMVSVDSFCLFANISKANFYRYMSGEHGKGRYIEACTSIVDSINQIRSGHAAADLLNANYIARLQGLADNQNIINYNVHVSKEEAKRISKELEEDI